MLISQLFIKSATSSDLDRVIGDLKIVNNATHTDLVHYANYDVMYKGVIYDDLVIDFPREKGAWSLLYEILKKLDSKGVLDETNNTRGI